MTHSYEELLKKAQKELPEVIASSDRFKIENIRGHIEGNKTVLSNFRKIIKDMQRDPDHALKFILKELATPGKVDGDRIVLGSKVPASKINKKIRKYASEYVLCPNCGKPDTKLMKTGNLTSMRCSACGTEHPLKGI